MVELQPIFKKAYWALAAGGIFYAIFVCAMTYPVVQRLYVVSLYARTTIQSEHIG